MPYKKLLESINPDLFKFLTVNINSDIKINKIPKEEIYRSVGNYFEIVGMRRQIGIFRWFLQNMNFGHKRVFLSNN